MGIAESDFWEMTLAELERAIESKQRIMKVEQQNKAYFDYQLADLVGRSFARVYSSTAKLPPIYDVYPNLFDKEQYQKQEEEQKAKLSELRFKLFTESFNNRWRCDKS